MTHFAGGIQRIGIDHDQPRTQGTKYCNGILQYVGHLHRDAITGDQVGMLLQVGSKGCRVTIKLGVGQRHPKVAECRAVGKSLA